MSWQDSIHLLYSQAVCRATAPQPGFTQWCPTDRAMLALVLVLLAFMAVVLVYALEESIRNHRQIRREEQLRRLRGP